MIRDKHTTERVYYREMVSDIYDHEAGVNRRCTTCYRSIALSKHNDFVYCGNCLWIEDKCKCMLAKTIPHVASHNNTTTLMSGSTFDILIKN